MKSMDTIGIVFANAVIGCGTLNGVFNIQLGAFQFSVDDGKVDPDLAVCCRLRMDMVCATQVVESLSKLIESTKSQGADAAVLTPEPPAVPRDEMN